MVVFGILAVAVVCWLVLAFGLFFCWRLVDEDVNHWNWPEGREGPALWKELVAGAASLLIAGTVVAGVAALIRFVWLTLASLG